MKNKNLDIQKNSQNNNRIAKNTVVLYLRMIFSLLISLYSSRILLDAFGVEDFGIFNVVGGLIGLFTFLNTSMTSATQRFLNFEIGSGNHIKLNRIFNVSLIIHFIIALLILILCETIGLWFLNNKMVIDPSKMYIANIVYQLSVLSGCIIILSVPFYAIVIANEKMKTFAFISITEVLMRLIAVLMLLYTDYNKLILYALLLFIITLCIRVTYFVYSKKHFKESKFKLILDTTLIKEMMSFASWSLIGNLSVGAISQGLNLLLNLYFGPILNAARAIALQVQNAVGGFAVNFQMAMDPQITKSYASKDIFYMHSLVFNASKYSYYLLLLVSLPILLETEFILTLWLKTIPKHTAIFLRIMLITSLIDSISHPLNTSIRATGQIKKFELMTGVLSLTVVPLSYIFLEFGAIPETVLIIHLIVVILVQLFRIKLVSTKINFSFKSFLRKVIYKIVIVTLMSLVLPFIINITFVQNFQRFFIVSFVSLISAVFSIYALGINDSEKILVQNKLLVIVNKIKLFR